MKPKPKVSKAALRTQIDLWQSNCSIWTGGCSSCRWQNRCKDTEVVISKAIRRGLSVKIFDWSKVEPAGGLTFRQRAALREGLPEEVAKRITKLVRDEFPKLHAQIQGDAVRVSGKSKDELQSLIARLRESGDDYPVALQFKNYR